MGQLEPRVKLIDILFLMPSRS